MDRNRTLFRCLVAASFIVGAFYAYGFSTIDLPSEWNRPLAPREWPLYVVGPLLALVNLVAYVGLLFLWRPARVLLVLYVMGTLVPLVDMPAIPAWLESLDRLNLLLEGVLLACMFLPPFSALFSKARSNNTVETDAQRAARGSL